MSFTWMRRIDLWAGKVILRLLGLITPRVQSLNGDFRFKEIPRRVICAKFIGLGSVVLSLPLLKALKEAGVQVAFWSFPGQAELVRISGFADQIFIIQPSFKNFLPTLFKSWIAARRYKADAFLDLEQTANFTALLARTTGAKMRIGFISAKPLREQMYTHLVSLTPERHMLENNLRMASFLNLQIPGTLSLPPLPEPPNTLKNPLPLNNHRKRIVINVNSSDLSWHRMWVEDSWVKLCQELLKDENVELVLPGIKSELPRVKRIMERLNRPDRVFNLAGKSSLSELLILLKNSHLVVSVDSGIMHLAAWAGVPLVGLFGPETPSLYAPRCKNSKVVWASLPCSPCLSVAADKITRCNDNQCMKRISVDQVYFACKSLLPLKTKDLPLIAA